MYCSVSLFNNSNNKSRLTLIIAYYMTIFIESQFLSIENNNSKIFRTAYTLHFFYKNNFIRTRGSFLLKI